MMTRQDSPNIRELVKRLVTEEEEGIKSLEYKNSIETIDDALLNLFKNYKIDEVIRFLQKYKEIWGSLIPYLIIHYFLLRLMITNKTTHEQNEAIDIFHKILQRNVLHERVKPTNIEIELYAIYDYTYKIIKVQGKDLSKLQQQYDEPIIDTISKLLLIQLAEPSKDYLKKFFDAFDKLYKEYHNKSIDELDDEMLEIINEYAIPLEPKRITDSNLLENIYQIANNMKKRLEIVYNMYLKYEDKVQQLENKRKSLENKYLRPKYIIFTQSIIIFAPLVILLIVNGINDINNIISIISIISGIISSISQKGRLVGIFFIKQFINYCMRSDNKDLKETNKSLNTLIKNLNKP